MEPVATNHAGGSGDADCAGARHPRRRATHESLEAVLCGFLTLALMPLLSYFWMPQDMAIAIGAAIAFLG